MRRVLEPRFLAGAAVGACLAALVAVGVAVVGQGADRDTARTTPRAGASAPTPEPVGPAPSTDPGTADAVEPEAEPADSAPPPAPADVAAPADCPQATTTVGSADELRSALEDARAGDVIQLDDGTYEGEFVTAVSGDEGNPIFLCGSQDALLDGGDVEGGYVFHLDGARYWHLVGFTVTNGQKGVMADGTVGSVIQGLTVTRIGDEAIHLRRHSTDNLVQGNTISDTGHRREKFGEGVYVGSAESNWCEITECEPDRSDRNVVSGNVIFDTTSESVDVKEGTTGGVIVGNSFDGSGLTDADSWVDVKGNEWLVEGNTGRSSPEDGFQTHEILEGWGDRNVFRGNTATVGGAGHGFALRPELSNEVACDNQVSDAAEGFSSAECVR